MFLRYGTAVDLVVESLMVVSAENKNFTKNINAGKNTNAKTLPFPVLNDLADTLCVELERVWEFH